MRVLVVEDEMDLATALAAGLEREGYAVDVEDSGQAAIDRCEHTPYDIVLLDLTLPDVDGLAVCTAIRAGAVAQPRILMLTARGTLADRVEGLDVGADDYLVKPFAFPELLARVRALVRRDSTARAAVVTVGSITLDAARHEATVAGAPLDLTPKEFALLRYFMLHPGEVLTAERLLDHVWDEHADPFTNTVRVTISNLRRKLRDQDADGAIDTVTGSGYRLRDR